MSWLNIQYESNLRKNDKRDGMKALFNYVQCFLSGLALYNKCKCFCAEFIADMDSFDFDCRLFLFFYCSKENIRSIGINSVLFLSIHYPVKWVVSGAVSFDVLSIISSIQYHFSLYISFVMLYIKGLTVCGEQSYYI